MSRDGRVKGVDERKDTTVDMSILEEDAMTVVQVADDSR